MGDHSWNGREANRAYLNAGDGEFWDVSLAIGLDTLADGRGFVFFDFDHDGDQDVIIGNSAAPAQLFVNSLGEKTGNGWLKVELEGDDTTQPIGATVIVHAAGRSEARPYSLGNAYASSHAGPLIFGLGDAQQADRIEVLWPGGERTVHENVAVNRAITLRPDGSSS